MNNNNNNKPNNNKTNIINIAMIRFKDTLK